MKYLLLIFIVFLFGCAATKDTVQETTEEVAPLKYDESFDPLSLNDDDIIIAAELPGANTSPNGSDPDTGAQNEEIKEINGFRVQILATKNIETASLFEQEASERFQNQGHKTYLIFEAPLYKIRVGDCKERSLAESLQDLAKDYGYRESFIVKSKILVLQ
jgi:hypothetical protein